MHISLLSLALQIGLVIHVIRTGRNTIWIWVLMVPVVGTLAYIFAEIVPEFLGSRTARGAARGIGRAIDPNRDLRTAQTEATVTGTVAAKLRLGEALMRRADYAGAADTYRSGLRGLYEFDPALLQGLAEAQFALGDSGGTRASLDLLMQNNPEFRSATVELLYARALEAEGSLEAAEQAYRKVAAHFPGPEATVRHAQLLQRLGRRDEARVALDEVIKVAALAPRHVRRDQAEWIQLARSLLGA
jgi:hypothetical protein